MKTHMNENLIHSMSWSFRSRSLRDYCFSHLSCQEEVATGTRTATHFDGGALKAASRSPYTVLLLGNYLPDKQFSMQRFTRQLANGLTAAGARVEIFYPPVVVGKLGAKKRGIGKWIGYIDKYLLFPFFLRRKLHAISGPYVIHICDHSNAPYTRWIQHAPHLVTCHDLFAVRSGLREIAQNPPGPSGRCLQAMILSGLKRSQCLVSVSEATRADVVRILGGRQQWTHVIPNALDAVFIEEAQTPVRLDAPIPGRCLPGLPKDAHYVMHVGHDSWYKNRAAVLAIYAEMAADDPLLHLVIVGPAFTARTIEAHGCSGLSARIHYLQEIDDGLLRDLYRAAALLIFPSLMEGFGWPVLEAQACGCPVATLDRPPMHQLNACPDLLFDGDPECAGWTQSTAASCSSFIRQNAESLRIAKERVKAFAARFSNESSSAAYISLYDELLLAHPSDEITTSHCHH